MGTIQLDYVLPGRFDLKVLNKHNQKKVPVILHHAVLGSLERFVGVLLEQYGTDLPGALRPIQVVLASVRETEDAYILAEAERLRMKGYRVKVLTGEMRLGDKIKAAELMHPAVIAVAGAREAAAQQLNLRSMGNQLVSLEKFHALLKEALD